jgi:predicted DNA-binding transcriptional regulator AlpA
MSVIRKSDEVGGTSETSALNNSSASSMTKRLLSKRELAAVLNVSERTVDNLVAKKIIPRLRLSPRMNRFIWARVEAALARYEIKEAGVRR